MTLSSTHDFWKLLATEQLHRSPDKDLGKCNRNMMFHIDNPRPRAKRRDLIDTEK